MGLSLQVHKLVCVCVSVCAHACTCGRGWRRRQTRETTYEVFSESLARYMQKTRFLRASACNVCTSEPGTLCRTWLQDNPCVCLPLCTADSNHLNWNEPDLRNFPCESHVWPDREELGHQEAKVYSHFLKDEYRGGKEKKSFIIVTYIYIYSSNSSAGWWFWNIFSLLRYIRVQPAYYKWLSGPKVILYWTEASSSATISCKKLESDLISLLISLSVFTFVLKIARKNNKEVRKSW